MLKITKTIGAFGDFRHDIIPPSWSYILLLDDPYEVKKMHSAMRKAEKSRKLNKVIRISIREEAS